MRSPPSNLDYTRTLKNKYKTLTRSLEDVPVSIGTKSGYSWRLVTIDSGHLKIYLPSRLTEATKSPQRHFISWHTSSIVPLATVMFLWLWNHRFVDILDLSPLEMIKWRRFGLVAKEKPAVSALRRLYPACSATRNPMFGEVITTNIHASNQEEESRLPATC